MSKQDMKNIHVLSTDKPSRLHLWFDEKGTRLETCELEYSHTRNTQHIYITSDEPLKNGDWLVSKEGIVHNNWGWNFGDKKIILTTDQDLIKDGVQAIEDNFLEWFVKNPSCEMVEVETDIIGAEGGLEFRPFFGYKIIIPKEGHTKCYCGHTIYCDCGPKEPKHIGKALSTEEVMDNRSSAYEFIDFDKQETLEEVAKNESEYLADYDDKEMYQKGFMEGAKWQQEQDKKLYSEEDLRNAYRWGTLVRQGTKEHFNEWFEQFKKK